jgi:hypothetical protein
VLARFRQQVSGVAALAGRVRCGNNVRRDEPLLDGHREVIGSFEDFEDVDLGEVTPVSLAVLQMCIDASRVGLPDGRGALTAAEGRQSAR